MAVQGAAGGNQMDITTLNDTNVVNNQLVGGGSAISTNVYATINNVGGSVGVSNQALCNGISVSTDPTYAATKSDQVCNASDPAQLTNASVSNVTGDAAIQGMSIGNSFEADSNAPSMPIANMQTNNAMTVSTVNAAVHNIGGATSITSTAIGNTGQIVHYATN